MEYEGNDYNADEVKFQECVAKKRTRFIPIKYHILDQYS